MGVGDRNADCQAVTCVFCDCQIAALLREMFLFCFGYVLAVSGMDKTAKTASKSSSSALRFPNAGLLLIYIYLFFAAINFLIETGTLLHFPDTSHGLRNLYFLDPVWLSECLQRIFNIKSSKSVAKNGVIRAEDLRMLLVGTGFTEQTEEQYFQFLAKFEIALPVANNRYVNHSRGLARLERNGHLIGRY